MADVPVLECPVGGEEDLDCLNWLVVRWNQMVPTSVGTPAADVEWRPDVNDEGDSVAAWTNSAYLIANDGTQAQMAYGPAQRSNLISFSVGFVVPGNPDGVVTNVQLWIAAMATWAAAPGYAGDAQVRVVVGWGDERWYVNGSLSATQYTGGASLQQWVGLGGMNRMFQLKLGERYTVQQLVDVLPTLTFQVISRSRDESFVTQFYSGGLKLVVSSYDVNPGLQTHYQLQVAEDVGFATVVYDTGQVADETAARRRHTIPGDNVLDVDGPELRYFRARGWEDGVVSGWSSVVSATYMSHRAARMLHGIDGPAVYMAEVEGLVWVAGHLFRRHVTGSSYLFDATLSRETVGVANVYPVDLEVGGERQSATEAATRQLCETAENSFRWDELGDDGGGGMGTAAADTLYVHLAGHVAPAATRAHGVGLVVVLSWAEVDLLSGPLDAVPYWPIVSNVPETTDKLMDFREGRRRTPSGNLVVRNVPVVDVGVAGSEAPWYRAMQVVKPLVMGQVLLQNRPVTLRLAVPGMTYAETLAVFRGTISWDEQGLLSREAVSLAVHGLEFEAAERKLATGRLTVDEFPHLGDGVEGKLKGRTWGSGHLGAPLLLVDTGEAGVRKPMLYVRENASAVDALYQDGVPTALTWAYDEPTQLITFDTTAADDLATVARAAWSADADGEELVPYDGGPATADTRAGALFRAWIPELGWSADADAFNVLDDVAQDGEAFLVRLDCLDESLTMLEALRTLEETRGVWMLPLPDGTVTAMRRDAGDLDAYAVIIRDEDLRSEPRWRVDTSRLGREPVVEYQGYDTPGVAVTQVVRPDDEVDPQFGAAVEFRVPTYQATSVGAGARLVELRTGTPDQIGELDGTLRLHAVRPGSRVLLELRNAVDESGDSLAWVPLVVLERRRSSGGVTLVVRRQDWALRAEERPGA